jgi:dipeptidyl aminopeptidase/acylaminoacyl peptidase
VGLKLLGCEVEFVRYPGGSHGVRSPSQDVDYARRELEWFARHAPRARPAKQRTRAS